MTTQTRTHRFLQTGKAWPEDIECECGLGLAMAKHQGTYEVQRMEFWAPPDPEAKDDFDLALREAVAAERRATVERIRAAVGGHIFGFGAKPNAERGHNLIDALVAILDEEASRSTTSAPQASREEAR